jgi:hypothetical protein
MLFLSKGKKILYMFIILIYLGKTDKLQKDFHLGSCCRRKSLESLPSYIVQMHEPSLPLPFILVKSIMSRSQVSTGRI